MDLREDKKVEYIELIYDLIFVYLIGRNASLLDRVEGGFVTFETFVNYLMFDGGEYERAFTSAAVISAMVNQSDGKRIADSFDSNFNTIINMVESDIKASDYKEHKTAIKNMFENGTSIAVAISVDGTNAGEDFIPSKGFIENVKDQYFKEK